MKLSDEKQITAPRNQVLEALKSPEFLRNCIPGCEEMQQLSETDYEAVVKVQIGPVKARFKGQVSVNLDEAPEHITMEGIGKGGVAGFAKGEARVDLTDQGEATILTYSVNAAVGGKLAQLGSRLIDRSARKFSDAFFANFAEEFESQR